MPPKACTKPLREIFKAVGVLMADQILLNCLMSIYWLPIEIRAKYLSVEKFVFNHIIYSLIYLHVKQKVNQFFQFNEKL